MFWKVFVMVVVASPSSSVVVSGVEVNSSVSSFPSASSTVIWNDPVPSSFVVSRFSPSVPTDTPVSTQRYSSSLP